MSFTPTQVRRLRSKLRPQHIRTREAEGVSLSYLEGWHVLAEANRIFGFDGWDRETISSECVWTKQVGGRYCAAYVTRIRIRVRAGEAVIVREGSGAGESNAATPGQAHEFAAKAAETDATKRALMTFGNAFGLSLYGGAHQPPTKPSAAIEGQAKLASASGGPVADNTTSASALNSVVTSVPPPEAVDAKVIATERPKTEEILTPARTAAEQDARDSGAGWQPIQPLDEAVRLNAARARIDKSSLPLSEPRRIRDLGHLALVASKPCLICGKNRAHAHHLKFAQPTALGRKVSDEFTVPLCSNHHRELHQYGDERVWWAAQGIDALKVAAELWGSRNRARDPDRRYELSGVDTSSV